MNTIRLIPAAAALAVAMSFGGQAFAQASPTSSPPVPAKDAMNQVNQKAEKSTPTSVETRDAKAAAKLENKQEKKSSKVAKKAARESNSNQGSLATGNAGDPNRPANSKP